MKFICTIILFVCTSFLYISGAQGLRFVSSNYPIDQRTSYDVFKYSSPEFAGHFDVNFDLSLLPEVEIGYILRIQDEKHPGAIYNLFYDYQGADAVFRFNEEGRSSLIIMPLPGDFIREKNWHKVRLRFDMQKDSLFFSIDDYSSSAVLRDFPERCSPEISFGKSGYFIDVPSFAIKNLSVGNKKLYKFPLSEVDGTVVHDTKGRVRGEVENPLWMMNDMYKWKQAVTMTDKEVACAGYDYVKKNIYWFDRDSIHTYSMKDGELTDAAFTNKCPVRLTLGTNFIDAEKSSIYAYEVFYDDRFKDTVTVASLDLETNTWTPLCRDQLYMQMHHHGSFFDRNRSRYTIFGGFGNMHYNGKFFSFDLQTDSWYEFPEMTGDKIYPRYFTSLGYDSSKSILYVFGGMGNESGEHIVGRKYLYDFYAVNLVEKTVKCLWTTDLGAVNIVPVRNIILEGSDYFYTLCYPESHTYSKLQLYRFSISDGTFEKIADTIPIYSDKIMTNANLYYDRSLEKLIATVQESDDDVKSNLKVYTLSLPTQESLAEFDSFSRRQGNSPYAFLFIVFSLLAGISATIVFKLYHGARKKKETNNDEKEILNVPVLKTGDGSCSNIPGSINLFGLFKAIDRGGNDVSELFTEKQRQMLCVLLENVMKGGISSTNLSLLLWPGRPADKMKSTRNATISYLRKSLALFDDIELVYRNGVYNLESGENFHCDYLRVEDILSSGKLDDDDMTELVSILSKGKFLLFENDPLFDDFKQSVESRVEPLMETEIGHRYDIRDYKTVLDIADIIFSIDPLNGTALRYMVRVLCKQKRIEDALLRYQTFAVEYRQVYDEDYPYQFDEL